MLLYIKKNNYVTLTSRYHRFLYISIYISSYEIKHVVWECESSKSPEPNDILFGCITDFEDELKVRKGTMFGGMGKTLLKP
jgi:hypothetical protein